MTCIFKAQLACFRCLAPSNVANDLPALASSSLHGW